MNLPSVKPKWGCPGCTGMEAGPERLVWRRSDLPGARNRKEEERNHMGARQTAPRMEPREGGSLPTSSGTANASLLSLSASSSIHEARHLLIEIQRIPLDNVCKGPSGHWHIMRSIRVLPPPLPPGFPSHKVGRPTGNSMAWHHQEMVFSEVLANAWSKSRCWQVRVSLSKAGS